MKENYKNETAEVLEQLDKIVETEQKNQQIKNTVGIGKRCTIRVKK
ncbi:hypothetical protein ID0109_18920 [Helicobacter pylori]